MNKDILPFFLLLAVLTGWAIVLALYFLGARRKVKE